MYDGWSEKPRNQGSKDDEDRSESADEVVEISNVGDEVEVVVDPGSQSGTGTGEITSSNSSSDDKLEKWIKWLEEKLGKDNCKLMK